MQDGWLEFNVPFQHKYGYIRDETNARNLLHSAPEIAKGTKCKQSTTCTKKTTPFAE